MAKNWHNLPHHILGDIMTMLGRESLNNLQKCRQLCQSWNVMVSRMNKNEKDTIRRKVESRDKQIREEWEVDPLLPEITTAANLAHHGMLGSVEEMWLSDMDLASVPPVHLASLTSCVTSRVGIINVSNCDLVSILDSLQCIRLLMNRQTLSSEETRALVRAMESRVEHVWLGYGGYVVVVRGSGEVSLDIRVLTQYSGQGECRRVRCEDVAATRYREEMRSWAQRINWRVEKDLDNVIVIKFPQPIFILRECICQTINQMVHYQESFVLPECTCQDTS